MDRLRNEVLRIIGEQRQILKVMNTSKQNLLRHRVRRECIFIDAIEGIVNVRKQRGQVKY